MQSARAVPAPAASLVHDSVYDEFVEIFLARISAVNIGDPLDPHRLIRTGYQPGRGRPNRGGDRRR